MKPGIAETLLARVSRSIEREGLLPPGPLVVAVSGGPDSLCLLHVLCRLRDRLGLSLHVAHLDHGIRGLEGEEDARFVAELARDWGLPCAVERRDVPAFRRAARLSLEEAAREVRYSFLAGLAREAGARRVALGHTADDQVETVLLHLLRGAGLTGLRGMLPSTTWRRPEGTVGLVRPLLEVRRAETTSYCAAVGLSPRQDSSNLDPGPRRNRLRLGPVLHSPGLDRALLTLARVARDEVAFFDSEVAACWGRVVRQCEGGLELDVAAFTILPDAVQRHLLRRALEEVRGDLRDVTARHIEGMKEAMGRPRPGKQVSLPRGLFFSLGYGRGILRKGPGPAAPKLSGEYALAVPGETAIPGWQVRSEMAAGEAATNDMSPWRALLDMDKAGRSLVVRARRPGDIFQPLGMAHPKKLQDFMVDAKVPRGQRDSVPLVWGTAGLLWVVGWRPAEVARVTGATQRLLSLEFVPQGE